MWNGTSLPVGLLQHSSVTRAFAWAGPAAAALLAGHLFSTSGSLSVHPGPAAQPRFMGRSQAVGGLDSSTREADEQWHWASQQKCVRLRPADRSHCPQHGKILRLRGARTGRTLAAKVCQAQAVAGASASMATRGFGHAGLSSDPVSATVRTHDLGAKACFSPQASPPLPCKWPPGRPQTAAGMVIITTLRWASMRRKY